MDDRYVMRQIEERRLEIARKKKKAWRDKNRDRINRYQREWRERFKQEHGVSYSVYSQRKQAERELENERQGVSKEVF